MGWRLAEEVAWARPERPGPEWWILLDIAQDARDETRQGMPGHGYLAARGKCSRATVYRRLKALTDAGLLIVTAKAAPGRRAVYEITEKVAVAAAERQATGLSVSETRPGASADADVSQRLRAQRVSKSPPTGLSVSDAPPVINSRQTRQDTNTALDLTDVEVPRAPSGQDRFSDDGRPSPKTREETEAARQHQADALNEWMRQHPEAAGGS